MTTYKIIRFYQKDPDRNRVIRTGLTLEEAQAHCRDPETSSITCTRPENFAYGRWFDGYTEED
jgi:hypothetical protein